MYVKISNGQVEKYPYTIGQLRKDNPNTSFPKVPSTASLADFDVYPVTPVAPPAASGFTKRVTEQTPTLVGSDYVQAWQEVDRFSSLAEAKEALETTIADKARELRDGGLTVSGMLVGTDAEARSLLLGAKTNPKTSRKIVTKGGKAELNSAQMTAIVDAVDDFIQAVMERQYDLLVATEAAQSFAELDAIDIDSGWPV